MPKRLRILAAFVGVIALAVPTTSLVRSTRPLTGATTHQPVWILIGSSAQGCSAVATADIATVAV